jgi:serine/threonine-protein kinase HipA
MATNASKQISVYANWMQTQENMLMGVLVVQKVRGKEIFSFEYDQKWLQSKFAIAIDPSLQLFAGKQFLPEDKMNFGIFLDSSPDRWGRLLMRRREALLAKLENRKENMLFESDYLIGVYDGNRMGGLRFKLDKNGDFLNNQTELASPPWTSLASLEFASLQLENENASHKKDYQKWLNLLINPGSSLGGARPKANVVDTKNDLWIAKFPSANDTKNIGAWEMVTHQLAKACGIIVPEAKLLQLNNRHHTFLSKRFDRIKNQRIHFASAMTLLNCADGNNHEDGISYLEIAEFILQNGSNALSDLEQLWRRILFSVLVCNTDDHLRNHGFLLVKNKWYLSPAYDINPNEYGVGLSLNINENSNDLDVDLVFEVARFFKIKNNQATKILAEMKTQIAKWSVLAKKYCIPRNEIELMKNVFASASI